MWSVWNEVRVEYSEYREEDAEILFMDYPQMSTIPVWSLFTIGDAQLEVEEVSPEWLLVRVKKSGQTRKDQLIHFVWERSPSLDYLSQKDKKDIQRWLQWGVHITVASYASSADEVRELKAYLDEHDSTKKVIAKIQNKKWLATYKEIVDTADGVFISRADVLGQVNDEDICDMISYAKSFGKSAYLLLAHDDEVVANKDSHTDLWKQRIHLGIDAFVLDEATSNSEDPLSVITDLYEYMSDVSFETPTKAIAPFYEESSRDVIDYILYNVSTVMNDMPIRAVVCYTTTGYTAARLASFRPNVPIIAFTKSDNTYRYINTLWGVKWYKVSQSFTYEKLKQVSKEMIRMMFKWSISLDEKIVLVQVNEHDADNVHQINGMELYRFKNM